MVNLPIHELLSRRICEAYFSNGWRQVHHPSIGQDVYVADQIGVTVNLRCPPETAGIWFLRHAWSGSCEITCEGETTQVDLQLAEGDDLSFVVPLPARTDDELEVIIRVVSPAEASTKGSEVWLLGVAFEAVPLPRAKSAVLSSSTRLVVGDWGRFLVLSTDTVIPTAILNEGAWAPRDIDIFRKYVMPGAAVLDVGANFGHHSIVFSKLVGIHGLVLAVEAQRKMFQLLNANCVLNNADNVVPLHMAASNHHHHISLYPIDYSGSNNFGSLGVNPNAAKFSDGRIGEIVQAACLDDIVEEHCRNLQVRFIKIDVQSYEKFVLVGLLRTLIAHRPTIFFEVSPFWMRRTGYDYREIYTILKGTGYRFEHFRKLELDKEGIPDLPADADIEWDVLAHPLR